MPSVIAIRHVPFEDLGLLAGVFERRGWDVSYRDAAVDDLAAPDLAEADLLVVLGGPIGAYEDRIYPFLLDELKTLERRFRNDRAVLGICLGSQLMARALGARVYPGGAKEIGWSPLQLSQAGKASSLKPLGAGAEVLHWHGDTFDLPEGSTLLASSAVYPHQAFAWGSKALALQFHLEATGAGLERWYIGHAGEIAGTPGIDVAQLRADSEKAAPKLAPLAVQCFEDWLANAV